MKQHFFRCGTDSTNLQSVITHFPSPTGNKIDLAEKREVHRHQAQDFAESQSMVYLETSAKESDNVEKLFLDLACELIREAKQNKLDNSDAAPMLGEGKSISYLSCCSIN